MKLYLFGGAELDQGQGQILKDLIKETIVSLHPDSVLHVPFARLHPTEETFKEGWFREMMADTGIEILDARNEIDLEKANNPLIFINGGHGNADLINALNSSQKIRHVVTHAECIVAESAGSKVIAEYMRLDKNGHDIVKGLGILKDTIIEPHYSEKNRQQLLMSEMKQTNAKYGIGIDCVTAIVVDQKTFPSTWSKIGNGNIIVKKSK